MRLLGRAVLLLAGLAGLSSVASAYYHWTFFLSRSGPFRPIPVKFDLGKLPGSSISFFVPKAGPAKMIEGDNYTALVSQIRKAAESWNVPQSALKVQFGGFIERAPSDLDLEKAPSTPAVDVLFDDDIPPGVLAYTEPAVSKDLGYLAQKDAPNFVPILRSRLKLPSNWAGSGMTSYSHGVFQTLVHEFGHALGLQHSMASGAMATSYTRNTSKTQPVTEDDIAGLAALYPTPDFTASTGSIAGHVSGAGRDANMASVVALSPDGAAIGGLAYPDGSYRIDGLAPGEYLVYAHPLPPAVAFAEEYAAGIQPARDLAWEKFPAAVGFETRFYPNTRDWKEATKVKVEAAKTTEKIDFSLAALTGPSLSTPQFYSYIEGQKVHSPAVPSQFEYWSFFHAMGALTADGKAPQPSLKVTVVGDAASLDPTQPFMHSDPALSSYMLSWLKTKEVARPTPVAITFTTDSDLVVLPRAFSIVPTEFPLLSAVESFRGEDGRNWAKLTGRNLSSATRILFDGADAREVRQNEDGSLVAVPPAGAGGHQAVIEAVSVNGQSSRQVQFTEPLRLFAYDDTTPTPGFSVTPSNVIAGTDVMVTIDAANTNFIAGKTAVGTGSSDVIVRQIWVVDPRKLLVNLTVKPEARLGEIALTISTGLQLATYGAPLQIRPRAADQNSLQAPVLDSATGLAGAPAGATIVLRTATAPSSGSWGVWIGDFAADVFRGEDGWLRTKVPPMAAGPQKVELLPPSGPPIPPVLMQVNEAAPRIVFVEGPAPAEALAPLLVGDRVMLVLTDLAEGGLVPAAGEVDVRVGGVKQAVDVLEELAVEEGQTRRFKVEFHVSPLTALANDQAVTLRAGTRLSNAVIVSVVAPPVQTSSVRK